MPTDPRPAPVQPGAAAPPGSVAPPSNAPTYPGGLAEATVVGRAQDGDLAAFELLVQQYQRPLYRLARQLLHDRGEAEDVVQDALVQAWRKLPTLADPAAFRGWVYQLTTRRCLDLVRRAARRRTDPADPEQLAVATGADPGAGPAEHAEQTMRLHALELLLAAMPAEQRTCWVLRELHDFSYAEIATTVQLPVSTVRGRIARAREHLTKGMQPWR